MQKLPYVVVANPHISLVYELYYKAFERFRVVPEIRTLDDNDRYCDILRETLKEHLTVIPNLAMGVLECQGLVEPDEMDRFMNTMLRAVRDVPLMVKLFTAVRLTVPCIEDLSSGYCRAASRPHRNFQLALAFSGFYGAHRPQCGFRWRSVSEMQCEGCSRTMWEARTGPHETEFRVKSDPSY